MKYQTTHELAAKLMALPDLPVFALGGWSGVAYEVGSPSVQIETEELQEFGIDIPGPWVQIYVGF